MTRPANVRNPFDWKRSAVQDAHDLGKLDDDEYATWMAMIDADEADDREQGQRELRALAEGRASRPWWKRIFSL